MNNGRWRYSEDGEVKICRVFFVCFFKVAMTMGSWEHQLEEAQVALELEET